MPSSTLYAEAQAHLSHATTWWKHRSVSSIYVLFMGAGRESTERSWPCPGFWNL